MNAGSYLVTATVNTTNATGSTTGTLTIEPKAATVTLNGLTHPYTGKPITVTATTVPAKLPVSFAYFDSSNTRLSLRRFPRAITR